MKTPGRVPAPTVPAEQFLSCKDVCVLLQISRKTLTRLIDRDPCFPKPSRLSQTTVRWRLIEILAYTALRAATPLAAAE
jgi:predicted DNA-binding transcriptional regulator AlpA